MHEIWQEIISYAGQIDFLELMGLIFGLVCVWFLIKQNILTWPAGIIYVLISFVIFWRIRLYGDFILHIFFPCSKYLWLVLLGKWQEEGRRGSTCNYPPFPLKYPYPGSYRYRCHGFRILP